MGGTVRKVYRTTESQITDRPFGFQGYVLPWYILSCQHFIFPRSDPPCLTSPVWCSSRWLKKSRYSRSKYAMGKVTCADQAEAIPECFLSCLSRHLAYCASVAPHCLPDLLVPFPREREEGWKSPCTYILHTYSSITYSLAEVLPWQGSRETTGEPFFSTCLLKCLLKCVPT